MVDRVDLTHSLRVWMKRSISGICSFLDAQFSFMPRAVISLSSGSNSQSVRICVILKSRCRYNLCTYVIPSAMFTMFRFLIIIPMLNMMCHDMLFRKLIPLICMSSHQMVTSFDLSRMVWVKPVILTVSTCWILRCTVLPFRCGMLGL